MFYIIIVFTFICGIIGGYEFGKIKGKDELIKWIVKSESHEFKKFLDEIYDEMED